MTAAHSDIGASSMERWSACPGSVRLSKGRPSISSSYAQEGTLAHTYFEMWMRQGKAPAIENDDMFNAVFEMVNVCKAFTALPIVRWGVEEKFDLSAIHPGCFGTCDFWWYRPDIKKLGIVDFKYGAGIFVPPTTPQIKYYALGAVVHLQLDVQSVELGICQPRIDSVKGSYRSIEMDIVEVMDFKTDLVHYAKATEDPNAPLVSGEHCRFCPAATDCPELRRVVQETAVSQFSDIGTIDVKELGKALAAKEAVKAWLSRVDEVAYALLEQGVDVPGWKLVEKRATRKWKTDAFGGLPVIAHLKAAGYSDQQIFEAPEIRSPAQMEAMLKTAKGLIKEFIESTSSGHKIAPESDPAPAVKPSAKSEFTATAMRELLG